MAITSFDDLVAAIVGYPVDANKDAGTAEAAAIRHSLWYTAGNPGAGAAPGGALNGAVFSSSSAAVTGQFAVPADVAGEVVYLHRCDFSQAGSIACLEIYDRLWGNVPVVTTTTSQAITSPTWPSRDAAGGTAGKQVRLFLECSSATGNGGAITNTTAGYTNADGTAGRTATLPSFPATAVAGTWVPFTLQAGDDGVRSVQSVTLGTSYVSGAIHLIAARLLARVSLPVASTVYERDWQQLGLPKLWSGAVPFAVVLPTGTSLGAVFGSLGWAQG
jgi:hypothetical protein